MVRRSHHRSRQRQSTGCPVGVQRRKVALEQTQAVQCKRLHAVQLGSIGNQTILIFFFQLNRAVHLLLVHPHTVQGAVVVLGDEFLCRKGSAVHSATFGDAALCFYLVDDRLRQQGVAAKESAGLKIFGIRQNKIAGDKVGKIFVHVKAVGEGDSEVEQDNSQRQGENGDHRFGAVASQVGFCHREERKVFYRTFFLAFDVAALGVADGFHR